MGLFRRFAIRSITTQLTMIVVISILIGLVATTTSLVLLSATTSRSESPVAIASRIVQTARAIQAARNDTEADIILTAMRESGVGVDRLPIAALEVLPGSESRPIWPGPLVRKLISEPGIELLERLRYPAGPKSQVILRLDGVYALVFDATTSASPWPFFFTFTTLVLAVALIFVLLLSVYAVRWIIAPLAIVAEAALSFGRSPDDDRVLANKGPREITQLADALNEMRTRIRGLLADRTRMLAAISHDLRTPLTRLRLRAERVADPSLRDGMLKDLVTISRMTDDTLRYLREDGKSEVMSRVDLPSLLQTVCSDFADVGHAVTYQGPARLQRDDFHAHIALAIGRCLILSHAYLFNRLLVRSGDGVTSTSSGRFRLQESDSAIAYRNRYCSLMMLPLIRSVNSISIRYGDNYLRAISYGARGIKIERPRCSHHGQRLDKHADTT